MNNEEKDKLYKKLLNDKYLDWYRDLFLLHKQIDHGKLTELKGGEIAKWQERTEDFIDVMARLVNN